MQGSNRTLMMQVVWITLLICLGMGIGFGPVVHGQEAELKSVTPEFSLDTVTLKLQVHGPISYRVWSTPSPSKVIIDLHGTTKSPEVGSINADDVLVKQIRITQYNTYTRVVMDLKQRVPAPEHEVKGNTLVVRVNKNYQDGYETLISPGVRYGQFRQGTPAGQVFVNYLRINPNSSRSRIRPALANLGAGGLQTVEAIAADNDALAGVNASFFAGNGSPLGLLILDGKLVSYPIFNRTALGITADGKFLIDQVDIVGNLGLPADKTVSLTGVNRVRRQDDIILYNAEYGRTTRTNDFGVEVVVTDGVVTAVRDQGSTLIPEGGFVISAHGAGIEQIAGLSIGEPVRAHWRLSPDWMTGDVVHAVGAGPRLLRAGQTFITGKEERFQPDVVNGRAPRTAFGICADGQILLVTVNGRQTDVSIGVTLHELAELMAKLGAVDALNLDGGGSATLVVRDRVLNLPSDGRERPVGSAILVLSD